MEKVNSQKYSTPRKIQNGESNQTAKMEYIDFYVITVFPVKEGRKIPKGQSNS